MLRLEKRKFSARQRENILRAQITRKHNIAANESDADLHAAMVGDKAPAEIVDSEQFKRHTQREKRHET